MNRDDAVPTVATGAMDSLPPCRVGLLLIQNRLIAKVVADPLPGRRVEYAFYLRRDGERIDNKAYGDLARVGFGAPARPGQYTVVAFRRVDGQPAGSFRSNRVLVTAPHANKPRLQLPPVERLTGLDALQARLAATLPARLDVEIDGLGLPLLIGPRKPGRLFVVLGGAVPDRETLPRFSRFSWAEEFPGTLLCVADPTLNAHETLHLGWYFGSSQQDATRVIAAAVRRVAVALEMPTEQIVTYGSSGGGFAALQLAARLGDGATAVAINAQTEVLRYGVRRSVHAFVEACLGGVPESVAIARYGDRLSALELWSQPDVMARCVLVQNIQDKHHYQQHFVAFAQRFGLSTEHDDLRADGRMATLLYNHPSGHTAEPRQMLSSILACADKLRWR